MTSSPVDQLVSINSQIVEYIEVLLAMGVVLAFAYVALRFGLPRVLRVKTTGAGPIEIVSRYVLTPKNALYLVKTGSQVSLIATSENGTTFLTAITPENIENIMASQRDTKIPPNETGFISWRQKMKTTMKGI
jgi:flagellar biogenesis protein FliO